MEEEIQYTVLLKSLAVPLSREGEKRSGLALYYSIVDTDFHYSYWSQPAVLAADGIFSCVILSSIFDSSFEDSLSCGLAEVANIVLRPSLCYKRAE